MPSRFSAYLDYESDLLQSTAAGPDHRQYKHIHRPSDSSSYRHGATSGPTTASTTQSSTASQACVNEPESNLSRRQRLSQMIDSSNMFNNRSSHVSGSNSTKPTGLRQPQQHQYPPQRIDIVTPTSPVQEWAHQVHIQQRRKYNWCASCHPPQMKPLDIPSEKTVRRVRIQEPTHCYE